MLFHQKDWTSLPRHPSKSKNTMRFHLVYSSRRANFTICCRRREGLKIFLALAVEKK